MYRVGVVGAGPGVSALHLPTLAGLSDSFEVVHIADGGSGRARRLAERTGAAWSSGSHGVLNDTDVDVVALCSPPGEHAAQILAAVAAGKRAVFCEKPLGTSREDIDAAVDACIDAEVALVVGTNHLFDPSWERVKHQLDATGAAVRSVAMISQSANAPLPAMWSRCQWLKTTLNDETPASCARISRMAVACAIVTCVS